ncbi:MAG TPA: polyprenol monophosphomannose synthase [Acidimicrobiia bacterium]|nr:polyprenol monophosphomannose synthase [Acidimicrobiia bacterium]
MRPLVIVPTYIEAENLPEFLPRVRDAVPEADVLVVDDNSPDGTADVAERVGAQIGGRVEVLRRPEKRGLGSAYRAGFAIGIERGYDTLVQIDADLSHDPATLPALFAASAAGADLVIGSRYVPGGQIPHWPAYRRALSRYGNLYAGLMLQHGVRDSTSGFRVFRADTLRGIEYDDTKANGYLFQIELAYRVWLWGGRTVEVPITFTDRVRGHSKMSWQVVAEEMVSVSWWGVRDRVRPHWRGARRKPGYRLPSRSA